MDIILPSLWPPNSSDLNPVDYVVWGFYKTAYTATRSRMWKSCTSASKMWDSLDQRVINSAIKEWHKRLSMRCSWCRTFQKWTVNTTVCFVLSCSMPAWLLKVHSTQNQPQNFLSWSKSIYFCHLPVTSCTFVKLQLREQGTNLYRDAGNLTDAVV